MPDAIQPTFEKVLETDIAHLAAEIKRGRENPELKNPDEKELVKEAIRAFPSLGEKQPSATGGAAVANDVGASSSAQAAFGANSPLPAYAQSAPPEVKLEIEYLLDVALKQGIGKAVDESHRSPYFVQDAFRDALAGRLYPELQKRGIVK